MPHKQEKAPVFISKLFTMLRSKQQSKSITWNNKLKCLKIINLHTFQQLTLPRYYRHNKFQSFVRQLNMYGFHKLPIDLKFFQNNQPNQIMYYHEIFNPNDEDSIYQIKRKSVLVSENQKDQQISKEQQSQSENKKQINKNNLNIQQDKLNIKNRYNNQTKQKYQNLKLKGYFSKQKQQIKANNPKDYEQKGEKFSEIQNQQQFNQAEQSKNVFRSFKSLKNSMIFQQKLNIYSQKSSFKLFKSSFQLLNDKFTANLANENQIDDKVLKKNEKLEQQILEQLIRKLLQMKLSQKQTRKQIRRFSKYKRYSRYLKSREFEILLFQRMGIQFEGNEKQNNSQLSIQDQLMFKTRKTLTNNSFQTFQSGSLSFFNDTIRYLINLDRAK